MLLQGPDAQRYWNVIAASLLAMVLLEATLPALPLNLTSEMM